MAEKQLFDLTQETTPSDDELMVAYGSSSVAAKNISLSDLKSWISTTSGALNTIVYEIGGWNMDSLSECHVVFTDIGYTDILKIRKVTVMIRNDDITSGIIVLTDITAQDATYQIGPDIETLTGNVSILISRPTSGFYDTSDYDDTSINRGWVIVEYTN